MFGYGPESKRARGYRHRLYARVLLLQDARGERIAFVVVDLGVVPTLLHRLVAGRVVGETGIGADRLILSATHTHSGPSHFMDSKLLNDHASSVPGFDSAVVEFLVGRISSAVLEAARDLRRARAAWAMVPVCGFTRNRSMKPFKRNQPPPEPVCIGFPPDQQAVDPTWTMLRVDQRGDDGAYRPAGALSVFAIHGTAVPSVSDVFDADIHGPVQRGLERHIDALNDSGGGFEPEAVHVFANGTQGDISPAWPMASRCPPPVLGRGRWPGGPRRPPAPEDWIPAPPQKVASCLTAAHHFVDSAGDELAARTIAIFGSLGSRLRDDLTVSHTFRVVPLRGAAKPEGLCAPRIGTSGLVGGADGLTRFHNWRFLGLIPVGFEQGGSAIDSDASGCQREKRVAFGFLGIAGAIIGKYGLPSIAQLTLARVGEVIIAAAPAELTVMTGAQIRDSIRVAAEDGGNSADSIAIIGLANGDLRYIVTEDEYKAQYYEGGSTLYGPKSAKALASEFARLARELDPAPAAGAVIPIDTIVAYPGKSRSIFPDSTSGPPVETIERAITRSDCKGDTAVVRWIDAYPGRLLPADGPVLRIERRAADGWVTEVWDDDRDLEVRAIRPRGSRGYEWEARWTGGSADATYRVVLTARRGLREHGGNAFRSCRR